MPFGIFWAICFAVPARVLSAFFVRKMGKPWFYCIAVAAGIVAIEVVQLLTFAGSLDIDDFILNFAGAALGFVVFKYTPARRLMSLCAWRKSTGG